MHRTFPEIGHATTIVSVLIVFVAAAAESSGTRPNEPAAKGPGRLSTARSSQAAHSDDIATGKLFAIPRGARMLRHIASVGDVGEATLVRLGRSGEACRNDPASVYCNTLSPVFWRPPGGNPNVLVADDIVLAAVSGCELDRYVIRVTGNADGDGVGGYTVSAALYPTCPGAGGTTPIPGTECQATFQDNGIKEVTCPAPPGVLLEQNMYLGISFDRLHCGIAVGAPATKGFSADTLDFPGFACRATLGGYEPASVFDYFRKAIQIVKLHQPTMLEVARDPNALRFGIPVTAIGGALAFIPGQDLDAVLVGALFSILVLFLFTAFVHLLCGYSKGKQEYMGFLQIIAVAGIIDWAVIIPLVGPLITIWSVVVSVSAAREVYQLTRPKAIFAVLISAMILWAVTLMIFTGPLARFYDLPTR